MQTDLPEPVVPAIKDVALKLVPIIGNPDIFLPKAIGSLALFF